MQSYFDITYLFTVDCRFSIASNYCLQKQKW